MQDLKIWLFSVLLFAVAIIHAQAQPIRVACIGNSVTYGLHIENREQNCYPAKLQSLLGTGYLVKNFGHSGATLLRKGHNPYNKTVEFTSVIAFKPAIAVIDLGLNDTDPRDWPDHRLDFRSDYSWLIDTLRKANPQVKIYVCLLTPIFSGHPRFKSGTRDWFWQIQDMLPQIARVNHVPLIDLHTPLYDRLDLFADNIHPDAEGAGIIARTVYQSLSGNYNGLKLPEIFASNMVLQRERPIPVYGMANTGDKITVSFNRSKLTAIADSNGRWRVYLPAMKAGGPYQMTIKDKDTAISVKNILIGDVWLCSGQSNMAFPLGKSLGGSDEAAHAIASQLRLYQLKVLKETDPFVWDTTTLQKVNQLHYFSGSWQQSDRLSSAEFSAVAYYFGKALQNKEHVPVGLIEVAVGGSPVESWIDRYTMEHDDLLVDMLNDWRGSDFIMKWCRDRADTNLRDATSAIQRHPYQPCYNYEAEISKLTGSPIKGVIWYQGESNAQNPELYEHLFKTLVSSWRRKWDYEFPFYFVQLSGINRPSWPVFRDMQRKLAKEIPNTAMAVSMDLGDSLNVHYPNKKPVGERLALLAEKYTYHNKVIAEGPKVLFARQKGKAIVVFFNGGKLSAYDKMPLKGFELVTDQEIRLQAAASMAGDRIILTVPDNEKINAVYYAMQPYTHANLTNTAGLLASTFILNRHKDLFY
jgi:sialate O-acetylesterase